MAKRKFNVEATYHLEQLKQELIKVAREIIDEELRIRVKDEVAMEVRRIFRDLGRA